MRTATLQMVSGPDVAANLAQARRLLEQAAALGAELALLPEYFCLIGGDDADRLALAEDLDDGPLQAFLAQAARELGLWLVGGTLPLRAPQAGPGGVRAFNTTLAYNPQGQRCARYDKMHLFAFDNGREHYDEARVLSPGAQPAWFDLTARSGQRWRLGLSVCYDLRFAELYRAYSAAGADVLLVPAAFTHTTGAAHWEVLLRARAIENLSYVLAAAQGGVHPGGRRTWGHAMAVGPWGDVLAQQASGAGVVLAELDAAELARCRAQLPALGHRRL